MLPSASKLASEWCSIKGRGPKIPDRTINVKAEESQRQVIEWSSSWLYGKQIAHIWSNVDVPENPSDIDIGEQEVIQPSELNENKTTPQQLRRSERIWKPNSKYAKANIIEDGWPTWYDEWKLVFRESVKRSSLAQ